MNQFLDDFMSAFKFEGLTFDDVSLITSYADFLPHEASVESSFSRNVKLNMPLVSAAMDTVTESAMAIAMARLGGLGVIHKNLAIKRQVEEVRKVKLYLNGVIKHPVVFSPDITVAEMLRQKRAKDYSFSGFPIVDDQGKLLGILTSRDIKFLSRYDIKVGDVMRTDLVTAPEGTSLQDAYRIMLDRRDRKSTRLNSSH